MTPEKSSEPDVPEGPFDDAELVLYSASSGWAEGKPKTENLEELGLVSWSLWARWEEQGTEIPIVGEASWHTWYSLHSETWHPDPAESVSDAFVRAIVEMVDEDIAGGWGRPREKTWDDMSELEKYVWNIVRDGFLEMEAAEPALVIDWCQKQMGVEAE